MASIGSTSSSVAWTDSSNVVHIRLYVAENGYIKEKIWNGFGWLDGGFSQPGVSSSAAAWVDIYKHPHIRVYVSSGSYI